jgi:DNA mismatch repair protein MutS2
MLTPAKIKPTRRDQLLAKAAAAVNWPELLDKLSARAESEPGKRQCLNPLLSETAAACDLAMTETGEAVSLYERSDPPPAAAFADALPPIQSARAQGVLEPLELVKIMDLLAHTAAARAFYPRHTDCPRLAEWAGLLDDCHELRRSLVRSIDRDGSVLDTASPALGSLRSQLRTLKERIHRKLGEIVAREPETVLQDNFFTQRGQRYVVPVKAAERSHFKGIVHDTSASGQTVFMEPEELIEPNNRLRLLEAEIEAEVLRVLRALSAAVGAGADPLLEDQRVLVHLDQVRARARLSLDLKATRPRVNDRGRVGLRAARHPLLVLRGHEAVANAIELGRDFQALLISGPNTGGKTVGLTMLGLFAFMTRAGIFLPAESDSEMALFKEVYAVIGDEQDLARDLSSFSSHLMDLIGILQAAEPGALVLLDELMSSTDPEEGAALAAALLVGLRDRGALIVATTHFPALKSFAHHQQGFANASYAFDPETLSPNYRLLIGIPGRSLGIEIAARLGLDPGLIKKARAEMDESSKRTESLLGELSKKLAEVEEERTVLANERRKAAELAREYRELRERLAEKEREFKQTAQLKLREAIHRTEEELKGIVSPLKGPTGDPKKARENLRLVRAKVDSSYGEAGEGEALDWSRARKGDQVSVAPLGIVAELLENPPPRVKNDTTLKVRVGQLTVKVEAGKIRALPPKKVEEKKSILETAKKKPHPPERRPPARLVSDAASPAAGPILPPAPGNTLDLRGERVHEAESQVERFLDESCRNHLPNAFIIHGHGTGALKQVVRDLLAMSPYVESFRPGERGEGGDGVTMVTLKEWGY